MPQTLPTNGKGLEITKFVLPLVLAIAGAWGTMKYTSGQTEQRLQNLESKVKISEDNIEKMNNRTMSREEMKFFMDTTRDNLKEIKDDLRTLRNKP